MTECETDLLFKDSLNDYNASQEIVASIPNLRISSEFKLSVDGLVGGLLDDFGRQLRNLKDLLGDHCFCGSILAFCGSLWHYIYGDTY